MEGWKLGLPKMGGTGAEMWLELKPGISPGKAPAPGTLGKMDERASEMKAREIESLPPSAHSLPRAVRKQLRKNS